MLEVLVEPVWGSRWLDRGSCRHRHSGQGVRAGPGRPGPQGPDVAAGSSAHGVSRASRVAGRQARSAAVAVMGKGTLRPLCQGCSTLPGATPAPGFPQARLVTRTRLLPDRAHRSSSRPGAQHVVVLPAASTQPESTGASCCHTAHPRAGFKPGDGGLLGAPSALAPGSSRHPSLQREPEGAGLPRPLAQLPWQLRPQG